MLITLVVMTTLEVESELDEELLFACKRPPATPPGGEVDVVAFLARAWKAASVFPVEGALIEAVMPDWQWLPVV